MSLIFFSELGNSSFWLGVIFILKYLFFYLHFEWFSQAVFNPYVLHHVNVISLSVHKQNITYHPGSGCTNQIGCLSIVAFISQNLNVIINSRGSWQEQTPSDVLAGTHCTSPLDAGKWDGAKLFPKIWMARGDCAVTCAKQSGFYGSRCLGSGWMAEVLASLWPRLREMTELNSFVPFLLRSRRYKRSYIWAK